MAHYRDLPDYISGEQDRLRLLQDSNIDFENGLIIWNTLCSNAIDKTPWYSVTQKVASLLIDQHWIIWDRHRKESWFRPSLREWHIYPRWVGVRQERHILAGTDEMPNRISNAMWLKKKISPETLGWNIVFAREDGEPVYLDWLPIGTDFMVYPEGTHDTEDKSKLIANLRLVAHQNGCGITWRNVATTTWEKSHFKTFQEHSTQFRGAVLVVDGPVWEHMLNTRQKVFIGLPTWHIK